MSCRFYYAALSSAISANESNFILPDIYFHVYLSFSFESLSIDLHEFTTLVSISIEPKESFTDYLSIVRATHTQGVFYGDFSEAHISKSWPGGEYWR